MAQPKTPWDYINDPPWVEVLDDACDWADLQTTDGGVATEVTKGLYNNTTLKYDSVGGGNARYAKWDGSVDFDLSEFVLDIHDTPNEYYYACYDTGQAVAIYGTALGTTMDYKYVDAFGTPNCIKTINGQWTNNPFWEQDNPDTPLIMGEDDGSRSWFGNHGFGYRSSLIYDACFTVDTDGNPDTGPPHTETWLTGIGWSSYKSIVIDDVPSSSPGTPTTYTFGIK